MPDETQCPQEQGPLPRSREAVDWWLKKWGRTEPLTREDVERLIEANGGTAEGIDLTERDMRGVDQWGLDNSKKEGNQPFNLQGANLSRAILQNANLSGANLQGTHFNWANLQEAALNQADLRDAELIGANLRDASLYQAKLERANLTLAVLQSTNSLTNLFQAKLDGANLQNADLQGASLRQANLRCTNLARSHLQRAQLEGANLENAQLEEAELEGTDLRRSNLQGAFLTDVTISTNTNLEGVKWDKGYISALERRGHYEAASAVYRRLKEWYKGAGMLTIAGEFHYREEIALTKAQWQRLGSEFKKLLRPLAALRQRPKGRQDSPQSQETLQRGE